MAKRSKIITRICSHCLSRYYPFLGTETISRFCSRACTYAGRRRIYDRAALTEHLMARVIPGATPLDCWGWRGSKGKNGYSYLGVSGQSRLAHRLSYELHVGHIPTGVFVCHHCDNPGCCNPAHLFLGTQADNMKDCATKGRTRRTPTIQGEGHYRAKVTQADVRDIRTSSASQSDLARKYGLSRSSIAAIKTRKSWKSVD